MTEDIKLTPEQQKIVSENHNLIYWYAHLHGLDLDEWYDILAIELCIAVQKHNSETSSLANFYHVSAETRRLKIYRDNNRQKRSNNGVMSLDEIYYAVSDTVDEFSEIDYDWVSPDVKRMIEYRLHGYTQAEIAEKMNVSQSQVSKLLNRFKEELLEHDG